MVVRGMIRDGMGWEGKGRDGRGWTRIGLRALVEDDWFIDITAEEFARRGVMIDLRPVYLRDHVARAQTGNRNGVISVRPINHHTESMVRESHAQMPRSDFHGAWSFVRNRPSDISHSALVVMKGPEVLGLERHLPLSQVNNPPRPL